MTNAKWVFDHAMGLMDEVNESTGATDTADTKEYKQRTLFILNTLRGELYPFSDTFAEDEEGKRPIATIIENFEDPIVLDDYICQSVMPYGLAAHLLLQEDPSSASFFIQRYEELKASLSRGRPAEFEEIEDAYGTINGGKYYSYYDQFGRW